MLSMPCRDTDGLEEVTDLVLNGPVVNIGRRVDLRPRLDAAGVGQQGPEHFLAQGEVGRPRSAPLILPCPRIPWDSTS